MTQTITGTKSVIPQEYLDEAWKKWNEAFTGGKFLEWANAKKAAYEDYVSNLGGSTQGYTTSLNELVPGYQAAMKPMTISLGGGTPQPFTSGTYRNASTNLQDIAGKTYGAQTALDAATREAGLINPEEEAFKTLTEPLYKTEEQNVTLPDVEGKSTTEQIADWVKILTGSTLVASKLKQLFPDVWKKVSELFGGDPTEASDFVWNDLDYGTTTPTATPSDVVSPTTTPTSDLVTQAATYTPEIISAATALGITPAAYSSMIGSSGLGTAVPGTAAAEALTGGAANSPLSGLFTSGLTSDETSGLTNIPGSSLLGDLAGPLTAGGLTALGYSTLGDWIGAPQGEFSTLASGLGGALGFSVGGPLVAAVLGPFMGTLSTIFGGKAHRPHVGVGLDLEWSDDGFKVSGTTDQGYAGAVTRGDNQEEMQTASSAMNDVVKNVVEPYVADINRIIELVPEGEARDTIKNELKDMDLSFNNKGHTNGVENWFTIQMKLLSYKMADHALNVLGIVNKSVDVSSSPELSALVEKLSNDANLIKQGEKKDDISNFKASYGPQTYMSSESGQNDNFQRTITALEQLEKKWGPLEQLRLDMLGGSNLFVNNQEYYGS
jgi:hypothetical protein